MSDERRVIAYCDAALFQRNGRYGAIATLIRGADGHELLRAREDLPDTAMSVTGLEALAACLGIRKLVELGKTDEALVYTDNQGVTHMLRLGRLDEAELYSEDPDSAAVIALHKSLREAPGVILQWQAMPNNPAHKLTRRMYDVGFEQGRARGRAAYRAWKKQQREADGMFTLAEVWPAEAPCQVE